jgi:hypothetical protein
VFKLRRAKYGPWGAYHGYWVEDLGQIEPGFGGEAALRTLARGLHARQMKLLLDIVLNHAAPDGTLVKTKPDWFHHRGGIQVARALGRPAARRGEAHAAGLLARVLGRSESREAGCVSRR